MKSKGDAMKSKGDTRKGKEKGKEEEREIAGFRGSYG